MTTCTPRSAPERAARPSGPSRHRRRTTCQVGATCQVPQAARSLLDLTRRRDLTRRPTDRLAAALAVRLGEADRGDVPGWVLVTVMTAGLVVGLAAVAGPALQDVFTSAIQSVSVP